MVQLAFLPDFASGDENPDEILDVSPVLADPLGEGTDPKALRIVCQNHEEFLFHVSSNR